MKYTNVSNPRWANAAKTLIDCTVTFDSIGAVPFTASPTDSTFYGPDIFVRCFNEQFGPVLPYTAPPSPPLGVPQAVSMRQARLALLAAGKLDQVANAIANLPSPAKEQAQIEWEYSIQIERQRPFVLQLGSALGLDDAALDALFTAAAKL